MLDKEWSCRAIPKPSPFSLRGPFLRSLVSRNYWPAVEKCGFALVPSTAMKEAEASASPCAFRRGEELPLTPAVCHKGPAARRRTRPLTGLPRLRRTSEQKRGLSLPSASIPTSGPRRRQRALLFRRSPALRSRSGPCYVGSPPSPLTREICAGTSDPITCCHGLSLLAFYFFRSLSSKAVKTTFKILKYLWSAGLQCCSLLS